VQELEPCCSFKEPHSIREGDLVDRTRDNENVKKSITTFENMESSRKRL
jgi:hypothetical protein